MRKEEAFKAKKGISRFKMFFGVGLNKLREGPLKCPFCKEVVQGIKVLGLHIKERHCH